jgi:asparagine synthase (glutamine-hydrolysing)
MEDSREGEKFVRTSLARIRSRGPDSTNILSSDWLTVGFNRLSIIDVSSASDQPLQNDRYIFMMNGEIYNYIELRDELKALGYAFQTEGDAEVAFLAYFEWGLDALKKFDGMFAISVIDKKEKTIILFRDHLGIKPLFYSNTGRSFLFGSDIRAIASKKELIFDTEAANEFIVYRSLLNSSTLVKNICEVPPRGVIKYHLDLKQTISYSSIEPSYSWTLGGGDINGSFRNLITNSIQRRLRSDVPIGLMLSGGIDSSLIAAIIQTEFRQTDLRSYSVSFPGGGYDESKYQDMVASKYGLKHTRLNFGLEEFEAHIDLATVNSHHPLVHPSSVPLVYLTKYAKNEVSVLIGGEGADEIFCGYPKYKLAANANVIHFLSGKPDFLKKIFPTFGIKKLQLLKDLIKKGKTFNEVFIATRADEEMNEYLKVGGKNIASRLELLNSIDDENGVPIYDQATSLRLLLSRFDSVTMASSIEGREVFCAPDIVDFANRLPMSVKIKGGILKKIVKDVASDYLPRELVQRKKMGFSTPINLWFSKGRLLRQRLDILLSDDFLNKNILTKKEVGKLIDIACARTEKFESLIWPILSYEMWCIGLRESINE